MWATLGFLSDHTSSGVLSIRAEVSNLFCWYTTVDTALAQNILGNLALDNILRTHSIMVRFLTLCYAVLFGGIRNGCLVHYATI